MLKPKKAFLAIVVLIFILLAIPVSTAASLRIHVYSLLGWPFRAFSSSGQLLNELWNFRKNAGELRELKRSISRIRFELFQRQELLQENSRLTGLLDLQKSIPLSVKRYLFARVIGRSPSSWNRVFLVDKGKRDGIVENMIVLADFALVGKTVEIGPGVSKILMITDPSSRIGVLGQRTRDEGVLYGTAAGECRMKYLSLDATIREGDTVETAGFGGFFPKGLLVGTVEKVWKEPGQMYQVASIKPVADLNRIEEVVLLES